MATSPDTHSSAADWADLGFVEASTRRADILERLATGAATPTTISDDTDAPIASISNELGNLRDRGLVALLVPESRVKGRYYGLTDRGATIQARREEEVVA